MGAFENFLKRIVKLINARISGTSGQFPCYQLMVSFALVKGTLKQGLEKQIESAAVAQDTLFFLCAVAPSKMSIKSKK